jgi:hypothetical protein
MFSQFKLLSIKTVVGFLLFVNGFTSAAAEPLLRTQTLNGPAGLVLMPSARMLDDGNFSVSYTSFYPYSNYVVSAQPLSWLQALFKYTDVATVLYGPANLSGSQTYKDKSVDIKVQLLEESYFLPEIALGINDVGGTGLFAAEYIVASKQYKNMDFSLGLGWGYLGKQGHFTNPLTYLSDSFKKREKSGTVGGEFNTLSFFAGEKVALFGGMEYHFESMPLIFKVEYDANNYVNDPGGTLNQALPFNFGMVYSPSKHIDLHAGYVRGDTVSFGVSFKTNLKSSGPIKYFDPEPVAVTEGSKQKAAWTEVSDKIKQNAGLYVNNIKQNQDRLTVNGVTQNYRETAQGIGRAARILSNQKLDGVNKLVFVEEYKGLALSAIEIDKPSFEQAARLEIDQDKVLASTKFLTGSEAQSVSSEPLFESQKNKFDYQYIPFFKGSYGGPDAFLLYQLGIAANANYYLRDNTWISGSLELGLADNYEEFNYVSNSNLPRVRTNVKEYLKTSKLRMSDLQLVDFETFADDFFLMGYAGYFESMYGGLGAEILYRPHGENWAIGLDANYAKQRDFDQGFGFRDYSVATGHLTGYYENDQNMLFKVSAGRYLAKDIGVTFDVSRKFRSGAKLGIWATKTNVSAEDFGEGSFDKGFYLTFPMNLFSLKSTRDTAKFKWQFLTRDGGQKLNKRYNLYHITDSRSLGFVKDSFENVLR